MSFGTILVERHDAVTLIRLNRPKALNALNSELARELGAAMRDYAADDTQRCAIITGSDRAFAAGADIKEMAPRTYAQMLKDDYFVEGFEDVWRSRKPVIAAVAGYALGGGCELAMMCDFIVAAKSAKFGQPEINLGVAPGIGGSQRLTRLIGRSKAMDLILTGRTMDAEEAERAGLVSRIVADDELIDEAMAIARKIASQSLVAALINKELVNAALETTLEQGLRTERRLFHSLFAFEDQKEGMAAFAEKREPQFNGR